MAPSRALVGPAAINIKHATIADNAKNLRIALLPLDSLKRAMLGCVVALFKENVAGRGGANCAMSRARKARA
jgi:hypothetical protein